MTLGLFLELIALGVVFTLIWAWIDPALAIVLGVGAIGTWLVVGIRFRPRWIKAFWAWCIGFRQDPYAIREMFINRERQGSHRIRAKIRSDWRTGTQITNISQLPPSR